MSRNKERRKAHRRAHKHVERAWDAVERGELGLAHREIQRALQERQDSPLVWNDAGRIAFLRGDRSEAERALRNAVFLAPDYEEARANLARLVGTPREPDSQPTLVVGPEPGSSPLVRERLTRIDWGEVARELETRSWAPLPGLLEPGECARLRALQAEDEPFEKTVSLGGKAGSGGSYRFFRRPLPDLVRAVRREVYACLVPAANERQARLGKEERYPPTHEGFLQVCAAAGQTRTTPILLRYLAPAENTPHRDVWGGVVFPYQLTVLLSPRADFDGGELQVVELGRGRRARRHRIDHTEGDGVVFCTDGRLVQVGGAWGLVPVRHGMEPLTRGERYVLGVPLHEFRQGQT